MKKKRKKRTDSNTAFGNRFHKKVEKLFAKVGFEITHSDLNETGPDIIAFDHETKTKIIIQCRATRGGGVYPGIENLISEYSDRRRDHDADLAILALEGYKLPKALDLDNAHRKRVRIITGKFVKEYASLYGKIRTYAKYQILSDLGISKAVDEETLDTNAFKIEQPGCEFLVASIPSRWLLKTASVYRRIDPQLHVHGYQRVLNKKRVKTDIPEYLRSEKWALPNAIICSTQNRENTTLRVSRDGRIRLRGKTGLLWVIDGQHRLYSFANIDDDDTLSTDLLAVIVDASKLDKNDANIIPAGLFYKLNHHAKRIRPSLVLELLKELIGAETPVQQVAIDLWESSLFKPIVRSYTNAGGSVDIVTLANSAAVKTLTKQDGPILRGEDKFLDGKKVNDRGTDEVSNYILDYLKVVRTVFRKEWKNKDKYIICDNRGFRALLKLLLYFIRTNKGASKSKVLEEAKRALRKLKLGEDFEKKLHTNQWIGEGGATQLEKRWIDIFSGGPVPNVVPSEEDENVEFKETCRWDVRQNKVTDIPRLAICKEVCAFLNTRGGTIYVGVDDDGIVLGIDRDIGSLHNKDKHRDQFRRMVTDLLNEHLGPDAADAAVTKFGKVEDKEYMTISVQASDEPTYFKDEELYVRQGARIKELKGRKFTNYLRLRFGITR